MAKNPGGRPSKRNELTVKKLEDVFKLGVSDEIACQHAGISKPTLYNWYDQDEEFFNRIQSAKNYARLAAGNVVMQSIVKKQDVGSAKWWLEKKHSDEFGGKIEGEQIGQSLTVFGNINLTNINNLNESELTRRIAEIEAREADIAGRISDQAST